MSIYFFIFVMAITTYLIRCLPLTLFKKRIENKRIKAFLHFVPYACLTTMTVPAIFTATASVISAIAAFSVAVILGFWGKSMPVVALISCIVVYIVELFI